MSLPPLHSDSSSTKENRDRDEAITTTTTDNNKANSVQQMYYKTPQHIAISKNETILLSSSGDVLVSRCRTSPYPQTSRNPYQWQNDVAVMCCDVQWDELSRQLQESSLMCSPWSTIDKQEGLLGGAPTAQVAPSPEAVQHNHNGHHHYSKYDKHQQRTGPRLRGGASAGKSSSSDAATKDARSASSDDGSKQSFHDRAQKAFRTVPLVDTGFDQDEESIVPIRSFDYSHYNEGGNDMLPPYNTMSERKEHKVTSPRTSPISVFQERPPLHGIPTFVPAFAQIKVTKLSAHPLGSHVLLISNAGLLYSYGLNTYGQLGIGLSTQHNNNNISTQYQYHPHHRGYYFAAPTIVTPLVENGGKAIACAAGVTHSLVVVATEEQRLVRSQSLNQLTSSSQEKRQQRQQQQQRQRQQQEASMELVVHHQLYGFGRNDYMKLGLVTPKMSSSTSSLSLSNAANGGTKDEMENVLLPRRVALRAKVRPNASQWPVVVSSNSSRSNNNNNNNNCDDGGDDDDAAAAVPPPGIFAVEASAEHSAALVRRASGDVELYTWGNAMHGALGVMPHSSNNNNNNLNNATTPILSNGNINKQKELVPATTTTTTTTIGVVPVPSFVATLSRTSNPRARSSSILLRGEYPTSISLGYRCSLVTTSQGRCFSFGVDEHGMLGLGKCIRECSTPSEIPLPPDARHEKIVSVRTGASSVLATTRSGSVLAWGTKKHVGLAPVAAEEHHEPTTITGSWEERSTHKVEEHIQWSPKRIILADCQHSSNDGSNSKIIEAAAGYDNAVLITESGQVLSCGTASGRLGLGEVQEDVTVPQPMFGGLKLWHQPKTKNTRNLRYPSIPRPRNKLLHRGKTVA